MGCASKKVCLPSSFPARTGLDRASIKTQISNLQRQGLVESNYDRYSATALGYQFLNTVLESF